MLNNFKLIELKSGGKKDYYIEGLVSTITPDDYNDIVTPKAQNSIDKQLKEFNITMDLDHEEWVDPDTGKRHDRKQDKIPVALVVKSSVTKDGTFVKAKLNQNHPLYNNILKSIKEGFLHSFSIAYDVTQRTMKQVGDEVFRFIDDLIISNIGITGNPVNKTATFRVALKSISKKMENDKKFEEFETQLKELKSKIDEKNPLIEEVENLKAEVKELKSYKDSMEAKAKKSEEDEDKKKEKEVKSKSKIDSMDAEIKELKSTLEKVRSTPIAGAELKSNIETKKEIDEVSFIGLM